MKYKYKKLWIYSFVSLFFLSFLGYLFTSEYFQRDIDFSNDKNIYRGQGWKNNQSMYSGSELGFIVTGTNKILLKFSTRSNATQEVEIYVNDNKQSVSSPNINNANIEIKLTKNQNNIIVIRHICEYFYDPCEVKLESAIARSSAKIEPYQPHKESISVIGDSISTMYGKDNYTILLADKLQHELHNSSILSSTLVKIPSIPNAQDRYKKDIENYKSSVTLIFLGTNDIANNVHLASYSAGLKKVITDFKKWDTGKLFVVGILPRYDIDTNIVNSYNNEAKKVAEENGSIFIDTSTWLNNKDYADDIHPTLEAHKIISNNIYQKIID